MPDQGGEGFKISLLVKGRDFTDTSASLASSVAVLQAYEASYSKCLAISANRFSTEEETFPQPKIGLVSSKTGSLDVQTILDIATFAAPLAPQVPEMIKYSLDLYSNASELIGIATSFFSRNNEPINVEIDNSPGASPIFIIGNSGTVKINSSDIMDAAKSIHPDLNNMATQIASGSVDTIEITTDESWQEEPFTALSLNDNHKFAFNVQSKKKTSDQPMIARCGIYSFNKKSSNGRLDMLEESNQRNYPFEACNIEPGLLIEALNANYSEITFNSEMSVNALGESKIKKIYIHGITNKYDDPSTDNIPCEEPPQGESTF